MRQLSTTDWVKLAVSRDRARPVLMGVAVDGDRQAGTDGHRLHVGPAEGLRPGLWDRAGQAIDGVYPTYDRVMPTGAPTHEVEDVTELVAVVSAAVAYGKATGGLYDTKITFECANYSTVALDGRYVLDVLRGAQPGSDILIYSGTWSEPVAFHMAGNRHAVVMPIRMAGGAMGGPRRDPRFDVTDIVRPRE